MRHAQHVIVEEMLSAALLDFKLSHGSDLSKSSAVKHKRWFRV